MEFLEDLLFTHRGLSGPGGARERYDEARTVEPGTEPVAVESPFGRLALSVCYDVRFPELYRGLGPFDALFVPSAFTVPTGILINGLGCSGARLPA